MSNYKPPINSGQRDRSPSPITNKGSTTVKQTTTKGMDPAVRKLRNEAISNSTYGLGDRISLASMQNLTEKQRLEVVSRLPVDFVASTLATDKKINDLNTKKRTNQSFYSSDEPNALDYNQYQPDNLEIDLEMELIIEDLTTLLGNLLLHVIRCNR